MCSCVRLFAMMSPTWNAARMRGVAPAPSAGALMSAPYSSSRVHMLASAVQAAWTQTKVCRGPGRNRCTGIDSIRIGREGEYGTRHRALIADAASVFAVFCHVKGTPPPPGPLLQPPETPTSCGCCQAQGCQLVTLLALRHVEACVNDVYCLLLVRALGRVPAPMSGARCQGRGAGGGGGAGGCKDSTLRHPGRVLRRASAVAWSLCTSFKNHQQRASKRGCPSCTASSTTGSRGGTICCR
jgi:hypothetical protein